MLVSIAFTTAKLTGLALGSAAIGLLADAAMHLDSSTKIPIGLACGVASAVVIASWRAAKVFTQLEETMRSHSEKIAELRDSIENLPCPGKESGACVSPKAASKKPTP